MVSIDTQQDFNAIPVLGLVADQVTSDSGKTTEGQLWTRTDLHVLKAYLNATAKTLATTDDSRFTDSRAPSGSAGGDLTGTYPNPDIAPGVVDATTIASGLKPSGSAVDATEALRALGYTTGKAMPGTARLDQIAAPTTSVAMNSQKITGLLDPTAAQDAATKNYVDSVAQGLDAKASVVAASTGNVNLASTLSTLDSFSINTNDRVLLKDQTAQAENGIYYKSAGGLPVRALDFDSWAEIPGAFVFVEAGATYSDTGWVCLNNPGGTFGTTPILWSQFASAGSYTAGAGLGLSGLDFSVNVDNSTIEINSDTLRVKALGITNAMLAGSIDLTTKVTGVLPRANGGTGSSSTLPVVRGFQGTSPALTAGTWTDVVHNLNSRAHMVQVVAITGEVASVLDWRNKSGAETSTIQIKTDIPGGRASGFYFVYVMAG